MVEQKKVGQTGVWEFSEFIFLNLALHKCSICVKNKLKLIPKLIKMKTNVKTKFKKIIRTVMQGS